MFLTKKIGEVIADLEYIVGSSTYNQNAAYGDGDYFRYPINVPDGKNEYHKIRDNIKEYTLINRKRKGISVNSILEMHYLFGSNELYIGRAIVRIMEYLEERYGIDFNDLEENRENE